MKKIQHLSTLILLTILISACSVSEKNQQTAKNETKPVQQEKPKEMTKVKFEVSINDKIDTFVVELYNETPLHRDNFIKLVNEKYYEGVLFHRVIKNFMIQGGDPDSKNAKPNQQLGNGGPNYTIPAEFNPTLFHKKGALAAARTGDNINPQKASSGSQFYIVHGKTFTAQDLMAFSQRTGHYWTPEQTSTYETIGGAPHLDGNYTVFGEVIKGMEVVDEISKVQTDLNDRPLKDVKFSISVIK